MPTKLVLAALLAAAPLAAQQTIHVPADQPTIQAGIAAAVDGDTVLVAPGTYVEQIDTLGKAITVRSESGAAVTTIDSQGLDAWFDMPYGPVVRMISGEGPSTVLQGFTITGADNVIGQVGTCGIWASGLAPTIRDCIVRDNKGGLGAGIVGDATIESCEIRDNSSMPYGDGGGLYGKPTVTDSVIVGNRSGGLGGGVYATGPCSIQDTILDANVAGNGADGYSGGAVFGPAMLAGCRITNNSAHHWFSGGPPDEIGTAVDGALSLVNCTLARNTIVGGPVGGDTSGALRNVGAVKNCIVWDNENLAIAGFSSPTVTYSILTGGYPGTGNLASDPLFVDAPGGDFALSSGSPAIDAGDPLSPPDPDGTVADMGALYFAQPPAAVTVHNGTGVNPVSYAATSLPVLGTTWSATVDATLHDPSTFAVAVIGVVQPGVTLPTAFGELLINPLAPPVLQLSAAPLGGVTAFAVPVPASLAYLGLTVFTQAAAFGTGVELTNALDLDLGI